MKAGRQNAAGRRSALAAGGSGYLAETGIRSGHPAQARETAFSRRSFYSEICIKINVPAVFI
jgi:hypothetical protein